MVVKWWTFKWEYLIKAGSQSWSFSFEWGNVETTKWVVFNNEKINQISIKWGVYQQKPDIDYISTGYSIYKNSDGKYVVTTLEDAEEWAKTSIVAPDPVVAAETTFITWDTESFVGLVDETDSSNIVGQKLPDVDGDDATYTLVVDTQETISKVSESVGSMTWVTESELVSLSSNNADILWGAEVFIKKTDWTSTWRNTKSVTFSKPVSIPIYIWTSKSGQRVKVKVKHELGGIFDWID